MKINQAIMAAMAEIGAISKNRKNPKQGYQFRGIVSQQDNRLSGVAGC